MKTKRGDNVGQGIEPFVTPLLADMAAFDGLDPRERAAIAYCGVKISAIDYLDNCAILGKADIMGVLRQHTDPRLISLSTPQVSARHSQLERRAIALIERVERRRRASPRR